VFVCGSRGMHHLDGRGRPGAALGWTRPAPARAAARGWSADDLARVAGVMAQRRLPPGAEVVAQGASSDALYFLRSGAARAARPTPDRLP
jgi:hypothetical protein